MTFMHRLSTIDAMDNFIFAFLLFLTRCCTNGLPLANHRERLPPLLQHMSTIFVIDPLNRTGKVSVPACHVVDTKGLEEYRAAAAKREARDFSLCLLYQRGRCNAGQRCHQIHVTPSFIAEVRDQAAAAKTCCAAHGDVHSTTYSSMRTMVSLVDPVSSECRSFAVRHFALTAGLEKVLSAVKSSCVRIPESRLCRLHQQRRCKFGRDCKNVHLCPDAQEEKFPTAAAAIAVPSVVALPPKAIDEAGNLEWSCGVSSRSASSVVADGSAATSRMESPRLNGLSETATPAMARSPAPPLSVDAGSIEESVKPLMTWGPCPSRPAKPFAAAATAVPFGEEPWSLSETAALDLSAFETTIRSLCEDLDRAAFSPNCAERVRSQSRFFAELLI